MTEPVRSSEETRNGSRRSPFDVASWRGKKRKKKDDDDFPRPSAGAVVVRFLPFSARLRAAAVFAPA